jgi:4-amino-4-deoxy-L-arabinose transferase-like glycosyltransferase
MSRAELSLPAREKARTPSDLASGRTAWLLFGVLFVALVIRVWGFNFGLPYLYHPDEPGEVAIIQRMFKTGDLNPHAFHYASLFYYLNLLLYVPYSLFEKLAGAMQSPTDLPDAIRLIGGSGKTLAPGTMLLGRSLSIALGVGTVALLFALVRDFTGKTLWGALAALWLAISPTHVEHSRYIAPDVMMTFFFTLTLWASWCIYRRSRTRDYFLAGLALGLTVASKYNGAAVLVAILLAHFLRSGRRGIRDWRLYLAFGVSALSFIVAMPYALLDTKTFLADLGVEASHYSSGHAGNVGSSLAWYLDYFWRNEGVMLLLASAGLFWGVARRSRQVLLMGGVALVFAAFVSSYVVHFARMALPLLPLLALLSAWWCAQIMEDTLSQGQRDWRRYAGIGALVVLLTLSQFVLTVQNTAALTRVNSRETARAWIDRELPAGARIALESYAPYVDPQKFSVQGLYQLTDHSPEWYVENGFRYLIFSDRMFRRFYKDPLSFHQEIVAYESLFHAFELLRRFTDGGYEVLIYEVPTPGQ